ncbi:TIM-barrel domain-containing protein [Melioribacter sp. OK-6-Me]|uniref:TIM-barrel domain-containing protein n=1 Tax=unclassified Melioribacter TaxID=2627329 RepID=UPI003ED8DAC2
MKFNIITVFIFFFVVFSATQTQSDNSFQMKTGSGSNTKLLKVEFINDKIVHVIASPSDEFSFKKSLIIDESVKPSGNFRTEDKGDYILLSSETLIVRIDKSTERISFYDREGNIILQEPENVCRIFVDTNIMGENVYNIRQIFKASPDEAIYGLGAHQNGIMNYKNEDVDLLQYNIVDIIPFMVSSKNYGILWDNYSHTKFGDYRDYVSLDKTFKLFSRDGKQEGLSAEYFVDEKFDQKAIERLENKIEHEYIDKNDLFPDGFEKIKSIRWEGYIESNKEGLHKLRLYCSGYTKMWIDDSLVVDSWRQNWLPWAHIIKLNLKKGDRKKIKIEWVHSGGYIGLKSLPPSDENYDGLISFYSEVADQIDYYFVYGNNIDEVIKGYRYLTGRAPVMPRWALGFWQCRERYKTQDELLNVVREYRKRNIPLDNIVQDWFYWKEDDWGSHDFDPLRFPDPDGMIKKLHDSLNTHIMISVWPKFYVGTDHYEEFKKNGWLYMRNVDVGEKDWVGRGYVSTFYDPYSEGARKLYWKQIENKLFSKGVDAWWLDATEPDIHSNLSPEETTRRMGPTALGTSARYRNTYSLLNSKAVYEGQRFSDPDRRVFILTRSAFAGQQKYSAATWSGDVAARWYDLKVQIPAGLNFSLSGIPYWTTDIGGFAVEPRYENPSEKDLDEWRELNTRWFQFGAFCPLFRSHGQFPYREIFNVSPEGHPAYESMVYYDKLRYRLMPYIYSLAGMVTFEDYTIMRSLIFDFPNDKNVLNISDQYMFGPAFMVNPVTEYKARTRNVYLPAGSDWYDFYTGKKYSGGNTISTSAPYERIPLFVMAGSIVPFGPDIQYSGQKQADTLTLFVYSGKDGSFKLYEDEGTNYNYEKGLYSTIEFKYNDSNKELTIGERKGKFPGMLSERIINIIYVSPDSPRPFEFDPEPDHSIKYYGKEVKIRF